MAGKNKKTLNTEIERVFSDRPEGPALVIEKPPAPKQWRLIAFLAFILAAALAAGWFFFWRESGLLAFLPADAQFYFSVSLPRPQDPLTRLYQRLDFENRVLPLLAGRVEIAGLPSGALVARTTLRDKNGWLRLVGSSDSYRDGVLQIYPHTKIFGVGVYWLTKGSNLYLSNQADLVAYLESKPERSLTQRWRRSRFALLSGVVQDISLLTKIAPISLPLPVAITAQKKEQSLVWVIKSLREGSRVEKQTVPVAPYLGADYDLAVFARDFSQAFVRWSQLLSQAESGSLLPDNLKTLEQIAAQFYNLDIESFLQKIAGKPSFFLAKGADWLAVIEESGQSGQSDISKDIQGFGASLFAVSHPLPVERTLPDGSKMTELRAESADLAWQDYVWQSRGQEFRLQALRGQGEEQGYFSGFMPSLGYVLTNSPDFLGRFYQSRPSETKTSDCLASYSPLLAVSLSPNKISDDPLVREVIKKINIGAVSDNEVIGCVDF